MLKVSMGAMGTKDIYNPALSRIVNILCRQLRADVMVFCVWEKSLWILEYRRQLTNVRREKDTKI